MSRTLLLIVTVLSLSFSAGRGVAQSFDTAESGASPWAVTTDEKSELLERAEAMLLWYRSMDREKRLGTSSAQFRRQMAPLEIMQAAMILKEAKRTGMSRMMREMLPFYHVTPAECFEIQERLGDAVLESFLEEKEILSGEAVDSTTRVRESAAKFLTSSLTPIEKMALMESPKTAFELMKAIDILSQSGRPVLVRHCLNKFLDEEVEPEEYARIAEKIGSKKLMQIAVNPNLAPQGAEAVARIYTEAKKHWLDTGTISQAIDDWDGFDDDVAGRTKLKPQSTKALHTLWRGDRLSVAQLIEKLGNTKDEKEADEILAVLVSFAPDVREALAETLNSDNATLVAHAARGLAASVPPPETFRLYPLLFAENSAMSDALREKVASTLRQRGVRLPEAEQAAVALYTRGKDYYERNRPLPTGPDGFVRFWNWSESDKQVKYVRMTLPAAWRLYAHRYARQAWKIVPAAENPTIQKLYLSTLFERSVWLGDLDAPIDPERPDWTEALDGVEPRTLEQVIDEAVAKENYGAARVAVTLLGRMGDANSLLQAKDGRPRSLVRAVTAPDRRVRFAALEAIMNLTQAENDIRPYPGSSYVAETLSWFSKANGVPILVSAHPKQSSATKTGGHFLGLGYNVELAVTCREAALVAADSPDVELLVVDLLCSHPPVDVLVQKMQKDARTAEIPIAVLTDKPKVLDSALVAKSLPTMEKFERISPDNPFAFAIAVTYPLVSSDEAAQWLRDDLMKKTGVEPVPAAIRLEQARKALVWIRNIVEKSQTGPKIYHFEDLDDIIFRALRSDARIQEGLALAEIMKSATQQAAIYEVAAANIYPMEIRESAAESFKNSIDRFGVLLRGKQVQRLYDRYNASETEEKESQELLSKLIDIVEEKTLKD